MAHYFFGADGDVVFERRSSRRHEVELTIGVRLREGGELAVGVIRDLSESGARVILGEPAEEGRLLEFRCASFAGTARVIWSRESEEGTQIGLSFVAITEGRESLHAQLAALSAGVAAGGRG